MQAPKLYSDVIAQTLLPRPIKARTWEDKSAMKKHAPEMGAVDISFNDWYVQVFLP